MLFLEPSQIINEVHMFLPRAAEKCKDIHHACAGCFELSRFRDILIKCNVIFVDRKKKAILGFLALDKDTEGSSFMRLKTQIMENSSKKKTEGSSFMKFELQREG